MKIVVFADVHKDYDKLKIPNGDMLIFAGDFSMWGNRRNLIKFNSFLGKQPHKYKIMIAGNHDYYMKNTDARILVTNAKYLEDEYIEIEGLTIYGSPYTPKFGNWVFIEEKEVLKNKWGKLDKKIDILITHGPPYGILDEVASVYDKNVGDKYLLKEIKRIKPKYHIFGHIHEGYGKVTIDKTTFINCSICDFCYKLNNKPIVFEIETKIRSKNGKKRKEK